MKGFKTFAYGLAIALLPALLEYLGGVDMTATFGLSPAAGAMIGVGIVALRSITSSPVFRR